MTGAYVSGTIVLIAVLSSGTARAQSSAPVAAPALITATNIQGNGGWRTDGKSAQPTQRWSLQVTRGSDNSINGRVTLNGSPLASAGTIHGHIIGSSVAGTITGDDGKQVATFQGTVSSSGMSGTYRDRTGEAGSWAWDGAPPQ